MTGFIEHELELLQKQIESTDNYMTKSYLLLKKIDLLKILEVQKQTNPTIKQILKQLRIDLKK